jgi:hypothetical protein
VLKNLEMNTLQLFSWLILGSVWFGIDFDFASKRAVLAAARLLGTLRH